MGTAIRWTTQMLEEFTARSERRRAEPPAPPVAHPQSARKFLNVKVEADGLRFDSKKERDRWMQLQEMERAGLISDLRRQVAFELAPAVRFEGERKKKPAIRYFADAVYVEAGRTVIEDTKSKITREDAVYRLKKHLMLSVLNLEIREI